MYLIIIGAIWDTDSVLGGCIAQILASHPAATGLILGIPKNFSLDVAEIY